MMDVDTEVKKMRGPVGHLLARWTALLQRWESWRLRAAQERAADLTGY